MLRLLSLITIVASLGLVQAEVVKNTPSWSQWRGPDRTATIPATAWPNSLQGDNLKQLWRIDLAEGYPGPIIVGERIYVAETKDKKEEIVRCLDRKTGKQLWEHNWTGSLTVPFFAAANGSWIRSTPACDGDSLYVAGIRDVVVCLDITNGKERWRADLMERYKTPIPAFGFVCSPLIDGDAVYVQAAASFLKLDKKTGKTIWQSLKDGGGMYGSAFSSPVIATIQGKRQLVVQTRTTLAGVDIETGDVLWKQDIPATRGMNILTPVVQGDRIFISAYGAKTYLFTIEKEGEKFSVKTTWTLPTDANMSSPVVVGKHAYLHLKNQRFCCVDLESGKTTWTTTKTFGKYWSMVACGEKILALDQRGTLYLIKANPEKFELIDERSVASQETWAHLAILGDEVFIRELKGMAVWRWTEGKSAKSE